MFTLAIRLTKPKAARLKKWSKSRQCLLDNICNEDLEGTQLLPLDAYSLLASRVFQKRTSCCSSTPPSSIDLEWEHEGIVCSRARSATATISDVEDSSAFNCGGASPESLEWDFCVINTDVETDLLIKQIEALTKKALMETGDMTIKQL